MITNPSPINVTPTGLWVTKFTLSLNMLYATLCPYDPVTGLILANRSQQKQVRVPLTDATAKALSDSLVSACATLTGNAGTFLTMDVSSPDPQVTPVAKLVAIYGNSTPKPSLVEVKDLLAALPTNPAFVSAYNDVISFLAGKVV